jgi:electron transfer flavoprotein beta subunit
MKILVCITHVPDTTTKITFSDNNTKMNTAGVQYIIGPYDEYALSRAIELRDAAGAGSVTVLHVGEADAEPTIRKALAIGADDAIRVNAVATDALFVAEQIAHVARQNSYDLILMGRESIDFNGGQVHGMVGELLGWPSVSPVMKLEVQGNIATLAREIEGGKEYLEINLPFVAGCQEPIAEWRIPNMRGIMSARTKTLQVLDPVPTSTSTSVTTYELPPAKGSCKMIDVSQVEELVHLLKSEAKVL